MSMVILEAPVAVAKEAIRFTGSKFHGIALVAIGSAVASALLFVFYEQVGYPQTGINELAPEHLLHIVVNVFANLLAVLVAFKLRGGLTLKFKHALFSALLIHAILIVVIFLTRQYYSRPIIISSFAISFALTAAAVFAANRWQRLRIGAIPSDFQPEVWGWLRPTTSIITSSHVDMRNYDILLVDWAELDPKWNALLARATLSGCSVEHVAKFVEERSGRVSIDHFEPSHAAGSAFYLNVVKRVLDVCVACLLLPLTAPLMLVAMIAIRITMGGPVVFTQIRSGRNGVLFSLYKLRTMQMDTSGGASATSIGDKRVTPLGKFLRRSRIDELPQLLNILLGEMSLVGPRPEQPKLCSIYDKEIPGFAFRHMVTPGVTGWAQIKAGYAANTEETRTKLTYDLYYIKHVSLLLDLWIMLQTVRAILDGKSSR